MQRRSMNYRQMVAPVSLEEICPAPDHVRDQIDERPLESGCAGPMPRE
jgi:hypothetical protein